MSRLTPMIFICVFLALWTSTECARGLNPCHPGRSTQNVGATECNSIVLPPNLCRRCRIRAIDPDGRFPDCTKIYRLNKSCRTAIAEYVDNNPCDTKRKEQLENIDVLENQQFLDFFIYAVCEECCDCVPFGAKSSEYDERKEMGKGFLIQLDRGNCPVHARFDVCKVWPKVRDLVAPGQTPDETKPVICPIIEQWWQSPLSNDWQTKTVTINPRMTRFLRKMNRLAKCRNKKVWEDCANLEELQGRI